MARKKSQNSAGKTPGVEPLLEQVAGKLANCRALKKGVIVVRASGVGGGDYLLDCAERRARLVKGPSGTETPPAIEIIGEARHIRGVLTGQKDPLKHFLAGGFRVRGDLRYFSDLALELGLLKDPL